MKDLPLQPFLTGLAFPESPRWHEGALWFSDFHFQRICRAFPDGRLEVMQQLADAPSGLGWLPDGSLLAVSMRRRQLLRFAPGGGEPSVAADLAPFAPADCNDMLVDPQGRAYVGNFGFDLHARAPFAPTVLLLVTPEGRVQVAADDMHFPNGTVLTPDRRTLIVGESYGRRLTAFAVADDGSLHRRRVWAAFEAPKQAPDGICLDAEGALWVASPTSREVLRVEEGGRITHRIATAQQALACMLGGEDRRTLYVLTGKVLLPPEEQRAARLGAIGQVRVDVPGAGWP